MTMTNVVLPFRRKQRCEYDCPRCGGVSTIANVGRVHWGVCAVCTVRWPIGENLFSAWRDETEEDWQRNRAYLASYREIHP